MPRDHGLRLHDNQGAAPTSPETRDPHPEDALVDAKLGAFRLPFVDRELLAEREDLEGLALPRPEHRRKGDSDRNEQVEHRATVDVPVGVVNDFSKIEF